MDLTGDFKDLLTKYCIFKQVSAAKNLWNFFIIISVSSVYYYIRFKCRQFCSNISIYKCGQ